MPDDGPVPEATPSPATDAEATPRTEAPHARSVIASGTAVAAGAEDVSNADLLRAISELKDTQPSGKDGWDKADVLAKWGAGAIVALIGFWASSTITELQIEAARRAQQAQIAAQESAQLRQVLDSIAQSKTSEDRRRLVALLPKLVPAYAVDIALQYITDPDSTVQGEALDLVKGFPSGLSRAEALVTRSGDPEVVRRFGALRASAKGVLVRLSETDDQATLKVNGKTFLTMPYLGDSGWVDMMPVLIPGDNEVTYEIFNGAYGGWHGKLEVIAGAIQQINKPFGRDACPCNAAAFRAHVVIRLGDDGAFQSLTLTEQEYL